MTACCTLHILKNVRQMTITICRGLSHPKRSLSRLVFREQEGPKCSKELWGLISLPILDLGFKVAQAWDIRSLEFSWFYTLKSLCVGDFGVKIWKNVKIFRGSFRGAKFLTRMLSLIDKIQEGGVRKSPILHTTWLESHALTLKNNTAKYYFGEKYSFLHNFLKFSPESRTIQISF